MASALFDSAAQHEKHIAYQDFIPLATSPKQYETLEELLVKANKWLESHPEFSVRTCETYNIKVHKEGADAERMSYMRKGQDEDSFTFAVRNHYLRCLRIWLIPHLSSSNCVQIGVKTFSPKHHQMGTTNSSNTTTLDQTIAQINESFRMNPVEGRIVSVETKPVKFSTPDKFNPSKSNWSELTDERKVFVFVIRVFFIRGPVVVELISFKDVPPELPAQNITFDTMKGSETFGKVCQRAQNWLETCDGVRICNMHSIDIKLKMSQFNENRQLMSYTEHNERATFYWRVLRIVCLTPVQSSAQSQGVNKMTYKTFVPVLLTNKGNFESMSDTFGRIHAWLSVVKRSHQCEILCVETVPMRFNTGGEKLNGHDAAWTVYKGGRNERWIYVLRIYFEGDYKEPPPNSLPYVPPVLEKNSCQIQ